MSVRNKNERFITLAHAIACDVRFTDNQSRVPALFRLPAIVIVLKNDKSS